MGWMFIKREPSQAHGMDICPWMCIWCPHWNNQRSVLALFFCGFFVVVVFLCFFFWGGGFVLLRNDAVTPRRVALTCVQRVVKFCHTSSHARHDRRTILSRFANVLHVWRTFYHVLTRSHTRGCEKVLNMHKTFFAGQRVSCVWAGTRCSTSEVRS